jgi:hypothetical protein
MPQQLNVADLTVSSPAFEPHGAMPARHSGDGEDVAPALEWTGVPAGTSAFAHRRNIRALTVPDRLGYAILFVGDIEGSVRFYRDVLGVPFRFANETYAEFARSSRSTRVTRCRP